MDSVPLDLWLWRIVERFIIFMAHVYGLSPVWIEANTIQYTLTYRALVAVPSFEQVPSGKLI